MTDPRPQVGLLLSCGEPPTTDRDYPRKLDWIRAKAGQENQYAEAAAKFAKVYGDRPTQINVTLVSDYIHEILDVRPKVWGSSGIKAHGNDNLAVYPPEEFGERIRSFDWELTTYPDDSPGTGSYTLTAGRDDAAVTRLKLKVYATLRVSIPDVTGLMMVAEISTTSTRSMTNWHSALTMAQRITGGPLAGIPFTLALRKARSRYWDERKGKRATTTFNEWVLESHHTLTELYAIAAERNQALMSGASAQRLALPPVDHADRDRDAELIAELRPNEDEIVADLTDVPFSEIREPAEERQETSEVDEAAESLFKVPALREDRDD